MKKKLRTPARKMAFTELGLKRLRYPKDGQITYWDSATKTGLHLLVSKRTKTFRVSFKLKGRFYSHALGHFGDDTTLPAARNKAMEGSEG
jgi:hypothetical protein